MASSAQKISLLLLLSLLSAINIHARDSQFFNKIPSNNFDDNVKFSEFPTEKEQEQSLLNKQDQEPSFIPHTENGGYGLYGHESGQLPPYESKKSETEVPFNKRFLPDNYNPVAYVTKPQGYIPARDETSDNVNGFKNYNNQEQKQSMGDAEFLDRGYNNNNFGKNNYYNQEQRQSMGETQFAERSYNNFENNNNNYYNQEPKQSMSETEVLNRGYNNNNFDNNDNNINNNNQEQNQGMGDTEFLDRAQTTTKRQGMSDTRFYQNGMYSYDINKGKFHPNHPYNKYNNNNSNNGAYYGSNDNSMEKYDQTIADEFEELP